MVSSVSIGGLLLLTLGIGVLGALLGLIQGFSKRLNRADEAVERINKLLPQTQCASCGYPGCRPYAAALLAGDAINKCAPGGDALIKTLAEALNRPQLEPDLAYGTAAPAHVVRIREDDCIGCARCAIVCPVDAILGAPEHMHTILADSCTGCDLCLPECPVDCIEILPLAPEAIEEQTTEPAIALAATDQVACIRCDKCSPVCPKDLMPQLLYLACLDDNYAASSDLGLADCVVCGICNSVCPSNLPLSDIFRQAQAEAKSRTEAAAHNDAASARAAARDTRHLHLQQDEEARRDRRIRKIKTSLGEPRS